MYYTRNIIRLNIFETIVVSIYPFCEKGRVSNVGMYCGNLRDRYVGPPSINWQRGKVIFITMMLKSISHLIKKVV